MVDYTITYCAPSSIQQRIRSLLANFTYKDNELTVFLDRVRFQCAYHEWYCGHYHVEMDLENFFVLYSKIKRLI